MTNTIEILAKQIIEMSNNSEEITLQLNNYYSLLLENQCELDKFEKYSIIAKPLILMMDQNPNDIDFCQNISALGYLLSSLGLKKDKDNSANYLKDRYIHVKFNEKAFIYNVRSALRSREDLAWASPSQSMVRFESYQNYMLYHDIFLIKDLGKISGYEIILTWYNDSLNLLKRGYFFPDKHELEVIKQGAEYHSKVFDHLYNLIVENSDLE